LRDFQALRTRLPGGERPRKDRANRDAEGGCNRLYTLAQLPTLDNPGSRKRRGSDILMAVHPGRPLSLIVSHQPVSRLELE
jgi:hypothetical protein